MGDCPNCDGRGYHFRTGAIRKNGLPVADYLRPGDNCKKCHGTGRTLGFTKASLGLFYIALFLATFLLCLAL